MWFRNDYPTWVYLCQNNKQTLGKTIIKAPFGIIDQFLAQEVMQRAGTMTPVCWHAVVPENIEIRNLIRLMRTNLNWQEHRSCRNGNKVCQMVVVNIISWKLFVEDKKNEDGLKHLGSNDWLNVAAAESCGFSQAHLPHCQNAPILRNRCWRERSATMQTVSLLKILGLNKQESQLRFRRIVTTSY